ncbi:MAG: GPR endopeptidase [Oscillospiraceae bacterium]|nr:GPR endopeptidase [Oscillospiraceae bacterium]
MAFRTDLAMERLDGCGGAPKPEGVLQSSRSLDSLIINTVEICDENAARAIEKPIGRYITIMAPPFYSAEELSEQELNAVAEEIAVFLPEDGLVLVVGLGNNDITPDAIGPRTARQIVATRHFTGEAAKQAGLDSLRAVAAITPGVLGQTGIETSEIVRSIAEDIQPGAVVVVDALAARDANRLGCTIQVSDTGISPGSGVQNRRKELSRATLGVPVISIGIPTVVDATTLANDILEGSGMPAKNRRLLEDGGGMIVTPRDIDLLIGHACRTLGLVINKALHPGLTFEEISYLAS